MLEGFIIEIVSNLFYVEIEKEIYTCTSRGKFKVKEQMPVVGDKVQIEVTDAEKKIGSITQIKQRTSYLKRPKIANIMQMVLVVSMDFPKPDLLLLDKQLAYLEWLKITPIICFNKADLEENEKVQSLVEEYEKIGYTVLTTVAKEQKGMDKLLKLLEGKITAFSGNSGVRKVYIN